jgi:4-amino-4-deoxy-L-arabinose transferase-like glycosyltransferase
LHRLLYRLLKAPKKSLDLVALALIVAGFVTVAAQRLSTVPVPETDESYTLQVAYQLVNHGRLSLPMYRYLGGNIENTWHSYTPLFFVILSGFLKVTGWGLIQGRVFNLITSALLLIAVYFVGRRLIDWRVGLIAVVFLVADPTFFERSRLVRNDFAAAAFAMLAYYLYEIAREKGLARWYVASGLAAGAGVMCHTNVLYMFGGIGLLILLEGGWRAFKQRNVYLFSLSALAVMAYEIVYDLIDYKNFALQNRDDRLHFGLFKQMGWWHNLVDEGRRYVKWDQGGGLFWNVPRLTLHIFEVVAALSIIYLLIVAARSLRRSGLQRPEVRLVVMTIVVVGFHAIVTSHKDVYYMAHLSPWFALCAGAGLAALWDGLSLLRGRPRFRIASICGLTMIALGFAVFGAQLGKQNRRYLREVRSPDLPSFDQIRGALREVVPEGLCPVAMKSPVLWLAFPEYDWCFASIEDRMAGNVNLKGQEYAIFLPVTNRQKRLLKMFALDANYSLLGEITNTPYGRIRIYYSGTRPELINRVPVRYYFLGSRKGFVTGQQVNAATVVWTADLTRIENQAGSSEGRQHRFKLDLKPQTTYVLEADLGSDDDTADNPDELTVTDRINQAELGRIVLGEELSSRSLGVFKTAVNGQVELRVKRSRESERAGRVLDFRKIELREVQ